MDEMSREYHPAATVFPLLDGREFEELKADIAANGLLEPIILHPDGRIIDGRNRHRACIETGTEPHFRTLDGSGDLLSFVVSMNLHRRHLTASQRAAVAVAAGELAERIRAEARERQQLNALNNQPQSQNREIIPDSEKGRTRDHLGALFNVNGRYVDVAARIKDEAPALFEQVIGGGMTIPQAKKKLDREQRAEAKAAAPPGLPDVENRYKLICCDIAELAAKLEPASIDHIITDAPYPRGYLPLYETLAELAARVLRPRGSLLVMVGQSYLPEIFALMTPHIRYNWTVAYLTPGGQSPQIWDRKVNTFWKPVLWFVKGEYDGDWIGDVSNKSNGNDKRFHHWGQSEGGMADLIDRFTYPGETILDPFVGGGTTGAVAVRMNRLFVGADIDQAAIEQTAARLSELRGVE